jgi:hypothetical protein
MSTLNDRGRYVEKGVHSVQCTTFFLHVYLTELNMEATWRLGVVLCFAVLFHLGNGQTRCFPFVGMLAHSQNL